MSVENVLARIAELHQGLVPQTAAPASGAPAATAFASMLQRQSASAVPTGAAGATGTALGWSGATGVAGASTTTGVAAAGATPGQRMVALAQGEIGQTEQPPGSNDSPRIAQYRQATAGSGVGPWCSYFVSWAAQQAGVPLGEAGQGFGAVGAVSAWAQRTGRFTPAGAGTVPTPGDLIVWGGQHIGMVESVDPDGKIHTIEGNSSNMVTRRTHGADGDGATGFVKMS
jgi:hypothetical protein